MAALEETFGASDTLLRETKGEVVWVSRLRAALERWNPVLSADAIIAQAGWRWGSANGASSNQPGATPQVTVRKHHKG